jgi:hypothetical protein
MNSHHMACIAQLYSLGTHAPCPVSSPLLFTAPPCWDNRVLKGSEGLPCGVKGIQQAQHNNSLSAFPEIQPDRSQNVSVTLNTKASWNHGWCGYVLFNFLQSGKLHTPRTTTLNNQKVSSCSMTGKSDDHHHQSHKESSWQIELPCRDCLSICWSQSSSCCSVNLKFLNESCSFWVLPASKLASYLWRSGKEELSYQVTLQIFLTPANTELQ